MNYRRQFIAKTPKPVLKYKFVLVHANSNMHSFVPTLLPIRVFCH